MWSSESHRQSYEAEAAASFNALRCANLNELLVALGAALAAVALQQLAQQADTLLHLLDGVHSLRYFLHTLLVLEKTATGSHSAQDQYNFRNIKTAALQHRAVLFFYTIKSVDTFFTTYNHNFKS